MSDVQGLPPELKRLIDDASTVDPLDAARKERGWIHVIMRVGPAAKNALFGAKAHFKCHDLHRKGDSGGT